MPNPLAIGGAVAGLGALSGLLGIGKPSIKRPSPGDIQGLVNQLPGGGQINVPSINVPEINVPGVSEFFAPLSIGTGAFDFSGGGGDFSFNRIGKNPLDSFDNRIGGFFGQIDEMRGRFPMGFSEVRQARQAQVDAARQRGMSSLQERLSNRRVQGSSFARAEQIQGEAEFGKVAAEQQAQSFLEEVAINTQLLQVERQGFDAVIQRAQSDLQEYALALQSAGLSAQVGTARSLADVQAQTAESQLSVQAQTAEAQLSVQAQVAQIESVLNVMQQLNGLSVANENLQQEWLSGIGNLIGTGAGIAGLGGLFGGGGVAGITSGGGGAGITTGLLGGIGLPPAFGNQITNTGNLGAL